jgi:hypothetical protein
MALEQKVFVNGTEVVGATADTAELQFEKQTGVVQKRTRLVSGGMLGVASVTLHRHISDDPLFVQLQKDRKASNEIVIQVFANGELIREFTYVDAVVVAYRGLGLYEGESVTLETLAAPEVTCGEVALAP